MLSGQPDGEKGVREDEPGDATRQCPVMKSLSEQSFKHEMMFAAARALQVPAVSTSC
jgi:hypothetical protein